ncbi:MAG: hypothetical protein GC171_11725 [Terrimonas sp.]|nr:hypothetical protein [Terrimonas sp.]
MEENKDLYDLGQLQAIAKGNTAFVNRMISLFAEQAPRTTAEIKEAYQQGEWEKLKALAHRLKPSIDNMGILSLKQEVRQIESLAARGTDAEELPALIDKMEKVIGQVVQTLKPVA